MTEALVDDLVVLPPVADDPIFSEPTPVPSAGDPHGFAALYIRHRWSFQLHARRFLSDQRDIDEVVQEGFLKLFLALPELETELQALAYARRTITNLCIDRYRADQRRPRLVDLESIPTSAFPEDDDETDPLIQAEDAALVREALAMLSPLHREALIKREIEEKPLPQIAAELDIPVEQVKHVLHRARRSLRRLLVGTHVEPGVDLDLALVLEANRARVAKAATPMGAALLALFVVLAGVLGLRPSGSEPRVTGSIGRPTGVPGVPDASEPHVPVVHPSTAPAVVTPKPVRPAFAPRHARASAGTRPLAAPIVAVPAVTVPSVTKAVPSAPSVVPPTKLPVTPVAPTAASSRHLTLAGLLGATSAPRIANTQVFTPAAGGATAFSQFLARTEQGPVVVSQTLSHGSDGLVSFVADPSLPVSGAAVPATLAGPDAAVTEHSDGTVTVVLDTVFDLPTTAGAAVPTGSALPHSDRLQVAVVYGADLATVLAERVVIGGPAEQLPPLVPDIPTQSVTPRYATVEPNGAMVRGGARLTTSPDGRNLPDGRDQEPLASS